MLLRVLSARVRKRTDEVVTVLVKRVKGGGLPKRICQGMLLYEIAEQLPVCLSAMVHDFIEPTERLIQRLSNSLAPEESIDAGRTWRSIGRRVKADQWEHVVRVAPHLVRVALSGYPLGVDLDPYAEVVLGSCVVGCCGGGHCSALLGLHAANPEVTESILHIGVRSAITYGHTEMLETLRRRFKINKSVHWDTHDFNTEVSTAFKYGFWTTLRELRLHWGVTRITLYDGLQYAFMENSSAELIRELHEGFGYTKADFLSGLWLWLTQTPFRRIVLDHLFEIQRRFALTAFDLPRAFLPAITNLHDPRPIIKAFQVNRDLLMGFNYIYTFGATALAEFRRSFLLSTADVRKLGLLRNAVRQHDSDVVRELRTGYGLDDDDSRALSTSLRARARRLCPDLDWPA